MNPHVAVDGDLRMSRLERAHQADERNAAERDAQSPRRQPAPRSQSRGSKAERNALLRGPTRRHRQGNSAVTASAYVGGAAQVADSPYRGLVTRIRAVGFDLDGTLFDHHGSAVDAVDAFLGRLGVESPKRREHCGSRQRTRSSSSGAPGGSASRSNGVAGCNRFYPRLASLHRHTPMIWTGCLTTTCANTAHRGGHFQTRQRC